MRIKLIFAVMIVLLAGAGQAHGFQDAAEAGRDAVDLPAEALKPIRQTPPVYPTLAKQAHVEGVVRLDAILDKKGVVKEVKLIAGPPMLVPAAIEAARHWEFEPVMVKGKHVEVHTEFQIIFELGGSSASYLPATPGPGSVSDGRFFSKFFKFSYPVPEGWRSYDARVIELLAGAASQTPAQSGSGAEDAPQKQIVLLALSKIPMETPGAETRVVMITALRVPTEAEGVSVERFLLSVQRIAKEQNAALQFPDRPYEVSFGGRQFFRMDGQATLASGLLYESVEVTELQGYVLQFTFTSGNQEDLKTMCKSLESIRFDEAEH